ncbi:MAG: hypothetical protein K940chlam2_00042 [Chlamydiae bacterium]|nr:hypothetical protein [Chlamydiota bacterium]
MSKKKNKRYADAKSIIGEELAEDLDTKSQEIIGRSGEEIDPASVVLKDEHGFPPGEEEGEEEEDEGKATGTSDDVPEDEEEGFESFSTYGDALTLNAAETYLVREKGDGVLLGDWDILRGVLTNIAGDEHAPEIAEEIKQFQTRIDQMSVKALIGLSKQEATMPNEEEVLVEEAIKDGPSTDEPSAEAVDGNTEAEAEVGDGHPLDGVVAALRDSYDEALETPVDGTSRLQMIQPAMQSLGESIVAGVSPEAPAPDVGSAEGLADVVTAAVAQAVAPLAAEMAELKSRAAASVSELPPEIPVSRAMKPGNVFLAKASAARPDQPLPGATSRIGSELAAAAGVPVNAGAALPVQLDGNGIRSDQDTPKLSAIVRASVGLRG